MENWHLNFVQTQGDKENKWTITEFLPAYRVKSVCALKFKREDVLRLIERVKPEEFDEEDTE